MKFTPKYVNSIIMNTAMLYMWKNIGFAMKGNERVWNVIEQAKSVISAHVSLGSHPQ